MTLYFSRAYTDADRRRLCAEHGVANTPRQWRKLRKLLGVAVRRPVKAPLVRTPTAWELRRARADAKRAARKKAEANVIATVILGDPA